MFVGKYEENGKEIASIYYKNKYGFDAWHRETFSPLIENIEVLDFKISGKTYQERKDNARQLAIDWQYNFSGLTWSWGEITEITSYFEKIGKRYGLLREFRENAIV